MTDSDKLAAWYREHGESEQLRDLEAALADTWQSTSDLAAAAHVSRRFAEKALPYLQAERRAIRRDDPHSGRAEWTRR